VASEDRLRELEEKYEDYKVYDNQGEKIGKVDDLFVDETDREEYIGVKMGFFGMKSTLIPMDIVRVNEDDRSVEVSESKDHVKSAPSFDDDEDITPDYENRIRSYFGLESLGASGGYNAYSGDEYADQEARDYGSTDYEDRSPVDPGNRVGSPAEDDSIDVPEYEGAGESSGRDDYKESTESTETTEDGPSIAETDYSADEATREVPTTRQTEETETFQEGGRTKIRRRVIREEVIEEDDASPGS
jgi:hypothetical protein